MKYVFKQIDEWTPSETTVEFTTDSLETILKQFEFFLRGSGYHFDGTIDIAPNEEYFPDELYEQMDVMPHIVNSLLNPPSFNATGLTGQNAN